MTDNWPSLLADLVAWVAPAFLFLGLYFWYTYNTKLKPKLPPEPEYAFQFNIVQKKTETGVTDAVSETTSQPKQAAKPEADEPELFFGIPVKKINEKVAGEEPDGTIV